MNFNKKILDSQKIEIKNLYINGTSSLKIAKIYNVTPQCIRYILKKQNIQRRKNWIRDKRFSVDSNFFQKIDNEYKAYVLGLLYADGHVEKERPAMCLGLTGDDEKNLLEEIKLAMKFTGEVRPRPSGARINYRLRISDRQIHKDLNKQGCHNCKTFNLNFPTEKQVPSTLIHHFIRGFFDGDGSVTFNENKKRVCVSFIGTENMCRGIKNNVSHFLTEMGSIIKCQQTPGLFYYRITGSFKFESFLSWIYKEAHIFLKRKKVIFDTFLLRKTEFRRSKRTSRFRGVCVSKEKRITAFAKKEKTIYLGSFKSENEAAIAYDTWCVKNGISLDKLNFPISNYII